MPEDTSNESAVKNRPAATSAAQDAAERQTRRRLRLQQRTILSDCSLMLRYALDESSTIPPELMQNITTADALLVAAGKDPLSDVPPDLLKKQPPPDSNEVLDDILLQVHNQLSVLVAPATALSLRETDPELVLFGMPRIVQWTICGACLFLIWFLLAVPKPELPNGTTAGQTTPTPTPTQTTR